MADVKLKADVLSAFNGGEITPELSGRVDKEELKFGTRYVSNFLPEHQGGLKKWYGTTKIGTVPVNVSSGYRVIPFDGASEPLALLFCAGNVYSVSMDEIYQQDFNIAANQIIGASYLQINDLIYFTNENTGMFQIQYYGIVNGHHTFKLFSSSIKEEPFFPISWRGNYNRNIKVSGYTGTITMESVDPGNEYFLKLPLKLQNVGAGANILFQNTISDCITGGEESNPSTVTTGATVVKLIRKRNGVDSVVESHTIGNDETVREY